jgi:hypothetical protein
VLARTTLVPNNPVLTDAAYDLLFRAAHLLGFQLTNDYDYSHTISPPSSITEEAFANFVRCLAGAFHSLGGTLYQAGKYGSAIRFLRHGCPLGAVALRLRSSCDSRNLSSAQEQPKTPGSKAEGWGQLHDQLSRRWELLGVSCSKIGDRQVSQRLRPRSNTVPDIFVSHRGPTKLSLGVLARMSFHVPTWSWSVRSDLQVPSKLLHRSSKLPSSLTESLTWLLVSCCAHRQRFR